MARHTNYGGACCCHHARHTCHSRRHSPPTPRSPARPPARPPLPQDPGKGQPACCTGPCEVVGLPGSVQPPSVAPINNDDLSAGIVVTMVGEQPTHDEPFPCTVTDPATGQPFIRTSRLELHCDSSVRGFAALDSAEQDPDNGCLYTLKFRTALACQGPNAIFSTLSGGWLFNIILIVSATLYLVVGAGVGFAKTRRLELPNAAFWDGLLDLVADGITFAFTCGGGRRGGAYRKAAGGGVGEHVGVFNPAAGAGSGDVKPAPALFAGGAQSYTDL